MSCALPPAPVGGPSLADVLRAGINGSPSALPQHHWRILNALLTCRTPQLGAHVYWCQECGRSHFVPHSCRNRHCPRCQGQAARQWLAQQEAALLPVNYFHLVFTLPHELNPLIRQNQRALVEPAACGGSALRAMVLPLARSVWSRLASENVGEVPLPWA